MAHKDQPDSNNGAIGQDMARVIVHETFPHKLKNGSFLVLEPSETYQVVKRDTADALLASGRGELDESDLNFDEDPKVVGPVHDC